ncbi:UDP-N-acetylglucosamine--N-acetylmuramyl-(pentapeptide) pyrophosphoryl-undecaprenol N-acetylglucosamine transferase [Solanum tuberosum]|uniref:UDP-N-acetylglucosamine--N-acetylmuramyl-(Pentapeptide) pyrophosphoryl-undecaprenol N-acetylglucosamine transferase n=2 Tax=Solanum tuberosum TaxID=4113 RepID=M1A486_SOLTU|nr:PREDICTED: UDP-N-acetylglucosamine--N-acetylmuramyl-(pentapeptide) pyrophosphoryl-undecaprenol N-acetylglucosamine transferase [Solanum tuberosum]
MLTAIKSPSSPSCRYFKTQFSVPKSLTLALSIQLQSRNLKISNCLSLNKPNNQSTNASGEAAAGTDTLRIILAAGGTGGHIYPAIAIADDLKVLDPNAQILFVGLQTGMESTAVPTAGYSFEPIHAAPLGRPLFSLYNLFVLPFVLVKSLIKSSQILKEFKPHIVIGTGGFVSFPICLAASLRGIKLAIQEQNSVPGIANRVLSLFAYNVFVAFNSSVDCFWQKNKCVVCGNPVRLSLRQYASKAVGRRHFFSNAVVGKGDGKVVLILGGSLGANALNVAILHLYSEMLKERKDLFLIWQTGVLAYDEMESLVKFHPRLYITPFLHSMDLAYAAADLVVSRAGAMICTEILTAGKPSILIPSPNVAEGHQFHNACLMADLVGSRVITEDELDSLTLKSSIEEILDNERLMTEMSERALKTAKPNASIEIARHLLSLVNSSMKF